MRFAIVLPLLALLLLPFVSLTGQQQNGKLQIHFMDVGQGDGAVLISPLGEVVLFDNGVFNNCLKPVSYLQQLGITKVDYHIASHYHRDHIGCSVDVLTEYELQKTAFDYGGTYIDTFDAYQKKVGNKRKTAVAGQGITLDDGTASPVRIEFKVVNGNGHAGSNENDKSVVALVHFGSFDAEFGGDLSGEFTASYRDVETPTARQMSQVEVYKVHHHGSSHSSNDAWLSALKPMIAIISAGVNNSHGHPTAAALKRLHDKGIKTYWTTKGSGKAKPLPGLDVVGGNIIVEVAPGANTYTVTHSGSQVDVYSTWGATGGPSTQAAYSWSKLSGVYHYSNCAYVTNISPQNLTTGSSPPPGKALHKGCPR